MSHVDTTNQLRPGADAPPVRVGRRPAMPPIASGARSVSWMSRGACRQADPELFFPIATVKSAAVRRAKAAKAVCAACAVRATCLSYALEAMPEGIWGGTTLEERRTARRRLSRLQANSRSPETARAAMILEGATYAGHAAERRVPPGRTAS
jgi:WhiB family transcriptional regulator, redox-sensing transcriptional regulator